MTTTSAESVCGICNGRGGQVLIRENGYHGVDCSKCGTIYTWPRPDAPAVVNLYDHGNAHIPPEQHIAKSFGKRLYARHHLKIIRKFLRGGDVLELGAGAGFFLDEARRVGFRPFALELNSAQARFIEDAHEIPCEQEPLSEGSFGDQLFDLIYHVDVLSHFDDPVTVFNAQWAKLKPGGFLIFETGNLPEVSKSYYRHISTFQYPDHLYFFGEQQIVQLLQRTRFEHLRTYRYSIALQLRAIRLATSVMKEEGSHAVASSGTPKKTTVMQKLAIYANFFVRYRLGRFLPKRGRFQTLIVVARKKSVGAT